MSLDKPPQLSSRTAEAFHLSSCLLGVLAASGRDPLAWMAAIVDQLPPDLSVAVMRAFEASQRPPEPEPKLSSSSEQQPAPSPAEAEAAQRAAWTAYLGEHKAKIEAIRNSQPPAEPPRGVSRWVAMTKGGTVLGHAPSLEVAHQRAIPETLWVLSRVQDALDGGETALSSVGLPEHYESFPVDPIAAYVKVSGPRWAVAELLSRGL